MTTCLRSYVCGEWVTGTGDKSPLYNPTTEAIVAETSTDYAPIGAVDRAFE